MRLLRSLIGRATLLALAGAGAVASSAEAPRPFAIDSESQYLLDVNIRQLRLGEGVRGYPTPEGSCLLLGDMATVLDVPITVDLAARTASGWAFREDHRLHVDAARRTVRFGTKSEALDPAAVRETAEGWCVDSGTLARWLGVGIKVSPYSSIVTVETEAKLPVELARERAMRATHLKKPAAFPLEGLPQVKLAYRMWRAPALDFIVSAGVTYEAGSGARVDRRASIRAAPAAARDQAVGGAGDVADGEMGGVERAQQPAFGVRSIRLEAEIGDRAAIGTDHRRIVGQASNLTRGAD